MSRTSRRQFAKTVAVLPLAALAQTPPQRPEEKVLREHAALVERLRAFPLKSSDEPDFTFSALTKRW